MRVRETHHWVNDGDPADGNVVCRNCDAKPSNRTAGAICPTPQKGTQ